MSMVRSSTIRQQHPLVRPRPAVAFGLLGISLAGVGVMLWGLDHEHIDVLVVGWVLSYLGGLLTIWIYWPEISKLTQPTNIARDVWSETIVAIVIIIVALALPPYLNSWREHSAVLSVDHENIVLSPDYRLYQNIDFRNTGELDAIGFNKGCFYWPIERKLTSSEERDGIKSAKGEITIIDISGFPNHITPGMPTRTTCSYDLGKERRDAILAGRMYLYSFLVVEYIDSKMTYGKKRSFMRCEYYNGSGAFNIAVHCNQFLGTYDISTN
jgi:hypothetical protein